MSFQVLHGGRTESDFNAMSGPNFAAEADLSWSAGPRFGNKKGLLNYSSLQFKDFQQCYISQKLDFFSKLPNCHSILTFVVGDEIFANHNIL